MLKIKKSYNGEVLPIFSVEVSNSVNSKSARALFATGADEVLWHGELEDLNNVSLSSIEEGFRTNISIRDDDGSGTIRFDNVPIRLGYHPPALDADYDIVLPCWLFGAINFEFNGPGRCITFYR